jgi:hypothetical protein
MSKSTFEIMKVEDEAPFYQLNNLPVFKLNCSLFESNDEDFDTGITDIDGVENLGYVQAINLKSPGISGTFQVGEQVQKIIDSDNGKYLRAEVTNWNDSDDILTLAHIGRTDGLFGQFIDSDLITGITSGASGRVETVAEKQGGITIGQNDAFDNTADDFLDFSENNPFGDPV